MLDTLRPMAIFARVAEARSFAGAAAELGLSRAVVSHHVARLESRLGVALLYRSTRRLSLTAEGEALFEQARIMSEAAETGLAEMAGRAVAARGELRLLVPAMLSEGPFVQDLATFREQHPGVRLSVSFSDAAHDLVREGYDLAIRLGPAESGPLMTRRFMEVGQKLVAAPSYLEGRPAPGEPADLTDHDWIRLTTLPRDIVLTGADGTTAAVRPEAAVSADNARAVGRLAMAGQGIALLPAFLVRDALAAGTLVEMLPGWKPPSPGAYFVWPENAGRKALIHHFMDFLVAHLRAMGVPERERADA